MTRPTDAVVIGFTKNAELCRRAFEPLLELRQQGALRDIHYVTWDSAEIDAFVAPVKALDGIQIARVPQPAASGNRNQRGIVYQTRNLKAAFARVAEPDALLVKLRPDYIFRTGFLKTKLQGVRPLLRQVCSSNHPRRHVAAIAVRTENLDRMGRREPAVLP